jgi:hypothetical protein
LSAAPGCRGQHITVSIISQTGGCDNEGQGKIIAKNPTQNLAKKTRFFWEYLEKIGTF